MSDVGQLAKKTSYRADIQGLRAVASLLVAHISHLVRTCSGGVDVFFVVSAVLITRSLLRQIDTTGRVNFVQFWGGLARRLLPAASWSCSPSPSLPCSGCRALSGRNDPTDVRVDLCMSRPGSLRSIRWTISSKLSRRSSRAALLGAVHARPIVLVMADHRRRIRPLAARRWCEAEDTICGRFRRDFRGVAHALDRRDPSESSVHLLQYVSRACGISVSVRRWRVPPNDRPAQGSPRRFRLDRA